MSVYACAAACGQLDGELACLNYDERRESWQRLPESPRRHCPPCAVFVEVVL